MAFKLENAQKKANQDQKKDTGSIESFLKKEIVLFGVRFNNKKKQAFYQELSVLLKAGITIKEALSLIVSSVKKAADKELIEKILTDVINGKPFSESIFATKAFSEYEYYSIKIGEESGTVAQVCLELKFFYERKNEQKRVVIAALTYPAIVLTTAFFVVLFMLQYVVPMFQDIFEQNKMELPMLTRMIVKLSHFTKTYAIHGAIVVILLFILSRYFKDNLQYKRTVHYLILKIPGFGKFITKVYLAQFAQAVALLTISKVPMLNSIQMVKKMINFVPLQDALEKIEKNILSGNNLSTSLKENSLFDNRIISLVKVAEETNQTEYVFKQLSEQFSQEVMQQSKVMTTLLEPLIILFIGVIVAVLLIAMYLPMFELSSAIK